MDALKRYLQSAGYDASKIGDSPTIPKLKADASSDERVKH